MLARFAALFLALFGTAGCSGLLYYPTRAKYVDETKLNPRPQEVEFKSTDGKKMVGWYFDADPSQEPKAVILFFHGNAQNISSHFVSLYWILGHGIDYFIFDYPGYGGSEGEPTPKNTVETGIAAAAWLRDRHPSTPLAIFGQSLGGAVALQTTIVDKEKMKPCMVAVESTFGSYQRVARGVLAQSWLTWIFQPMAYVLMSDRHAPRKRLESLRPVPLIVIHGDRDPVISVEHGRDLFEKAAEPKELWLVPEGNHIDTFTGPRKNEFQRKFVDALDHHCF